MPLALLVPDATERRKRGPRLHDFIIDTIFVRSSTAPPLGKVMPTPPCARRGCIKSIIVGSRLSKDDGIFVVEADPDTLLASGYWIELLRIHHVGRDFRPMVGY